MSVYDGCITIILSNGTIVAQGGVVYDYCKGLQVTSHLTGEPLDIGMSGDRRGVRVVRVWSVWPGDLL